LKTKALGRPLKIAYGPNMRLKKISELCHYGYKKITNFTLILNLQSYLSEKMPPKKVIAKNIILNSYVEKMHVL
jgi:hypothetical protein